jgi:hypothetical protein
MKRFIQKIHELFVWLFSRKVGEAINAGATYEEVEQIVNAEVNKK